MVGRRLRRVRVGAVLALQLAVAGGVRAETLVSNGFALELPRGLQADSAYVPDGNPLSADKIALGGLLFFDPRLSRDGTVSCATCHDPAHGFADRERVSKGVGGAPGRRNTPTIINRLFSQEQFWDGRADDLEGQATGPLLDRSEMGNASADAVVQTVASVRGYAPWFGRAFGDEAVTIDRIARAIASYERSVVSGDSPFDRWRAGEAGAMSAAAIRGFDLFQVKANCQDCHVGPNFTDEAFNNIGVGADRPNPDLGRFEITGIAVRSGAFKTPTLRNVAQTAPYMHDGSEATLRDVVQFYDRGGVENTWLSHEIKPLHLEAQEIDDLVAFLESLTGEVRNATRPDRLPE
jgi:cytochrome c peroxidase